MGYGMMIAAAMGDKTAFDKFAGYVSSNSSGGLMTWKSGQSGSASDADLDIAYAIPDGQPASGRVEATRPSPTAWHRRLLAVTS